MKRPSAPHLALHQLSLYNAGRMPPGQIIAAFAARRPVLDRILADLAAEKVASRAQHHLIVGPRGMGKTMLLARLAAELRTNEALRPRFIPLVFAEEQYAVDRPSKFWLNCLDSLADARELAQDTDAVAEIDATVARLTAVAARPVKDDQLFADEVFAAFAQAAQASGQRPVLFVDNLQLVFERLEKPQQHSLRELLMRPGAPILVGASASPPAQTQDYGAAFYDHFKVHYLRPLEEAEMRNLLVHLADAAQRDDVRARVLQHPARLKVLCLLTGGNPRTALTLFLLYAEDFAPNAFGDLESLLDRVTPLYKARFEELAPQQQVITSAIANHWDPVTGATLVQKTALPAGTISAQLDRLEKAGTLERVELFGETRIGYQIAERCFNLWLLMRSASRRQRRAVEFLTGFLERFHERPALPPTTVREGPEAARLHEALAAAGEANWGIACAALGRALESRALEITDDWQHASAVLLHLNYGAELLAFLDQRGDTARLRPWVEALRALHLGDRRALQNVAPEIRGTAEIFYDDIEQRLRELPEKNRRRPIPTPKRARARRK